MQTETKLLGGALLAITLGVVACHPVRNVYLSHTNRTPIPVDFFHEVRPQVSVRTEIDEASSSDGRFHLWVKNNSPFPIYRMGFRCIAETNDDGLMEADIDSLFEVPIQPGETREGEVKMWGLYDVTNHHCAVTRLKTPASWWDGV